MKKQLWLTKEECIILIMLLDCSAKRMMDRSGAITLNQEQNVATIFCEDTIRLVRERLEKL